MKNDLNSLVDEIISKFEVHSEEQLSLCFNENQTLMLKIEEASLSNSWVRFKEQTFDGWYCTRRSTKAVYYDVFYRERGTVAWGVSTFKSQSEAYASVIVQSGYATF